MKIVVIGSGFGGLSCALRLQAQGHQVTIVEKRKKLGGRAFVYEQDGSNITLAMFDEKRRNRLKPTLTTFALLKKYFLMGKLKRLCNLSFLNAVFNLEFILFK